MHSLKSLEKNIILQANPSLASLSCVRKCILKNGKLYSTPGFTLDVIQDELLLEAREGKILKDSIQGRMPKRAIIHLENLDNESVEFNLFVDEKVRGFLFKYEKYTKKCIINDEDLVHTSKESIHEKSVQLQDGLKEFDMLVDHSSVEIFINGGEYVLSSRIFPTAEEHLLRMMAKNVNLTIYSTKQITSDHFIL